MTELHTITGEGSVNVIVHGGNDGSLSTVKFRLKSLANPQNIEIDPGNVPFLPGRSRASLDKRDIDELIGSPAYRNSAHPGHKDIHEIVQEWFQKQYGTAPQKRDATDRAVKRPMPPLQKPGMGGPVHVRSHTREGGKERVKAHTRSRSK